MVTLSINSLREDDSAIYTCKAVNLLGEAVSTCTLKIEGKLSDNYSYFLLSSGQTIFQLFPISDRHWLISKPQHPEALPYIEALEEPKVDRKDYPELTFESPVFISHLNNIECAEDDNVRFECRVEPAKDPTLQIGKKTKFKNISLLRALLLLF